MIEAPYFRHNENKCPVCGMLQTGAQEEKECSTCATRFNKFMIVELGYDYAYRHN